MVRGRDGVLTLVGFLAAINLVAWSVSLALLIVPTPGPGSGPTTGYRRSEHYADGRAFLITTNHETGAVRREQTRPATWEGLGAVWWPVLAAFVFSDLVIWFFRRDAARRLWEVIRDCRKTIGGGMIAVAVVAVELAVLLAWMGSVRINFEAASWSGILLCVFVWNLLALIPIGIFVSYLPRSHQEEPMISHPARPGSKAAGP